MEKSITSAQANREFSRLMREVGDGKTFTITSHGKPVARLMPAHDEARARQAAFEALLQRLESQSPTDIGPWTREELYDRGER